MHNRGKVGISLRGPGWGSHDEARGRERKSTQYGHAKGLSTERRATRAPDVTDRVQRIVSEWMASQESLAPVRSGRGWLGEREDLLAVTAGSPSP